MNKQIAQDCVEINASTLVFAWAQLANNLWEPLGCIGNIKMISGCSFKGHDVTSFISNGLFWGYILWLPLLLLGIWSAGKHVQENLLSCGQAIPVFNYRDAYKVSGKSLLIWTAVSGVGASAVLVTLYPKEARKSYRMGCSFSCFGGSIMVSY
ncbi:MAG: hypothetical protein R3E61_00085 [Pseudomonadales bacterium]